MRWFDWLAILAMIWALKISFDEDFRSSKLERLYAIDEKPSAAVGPSPSSDKKSRRGRWMTWRRTQNTISLWFVDSPNACFAWVMKGYLISIESTSTSNRTKWWMRLGSTWRGSPQRIKSRVRIHNARQQDWSCLVWWLSRIISRSCTKSFCERRPVRISCVLFLPCVSLAIFKDQCVELIVLYQDAIGWRYK